MAFGLPSRAEEIPLAIQTPFSVASTSSGLLEAHSLHDPNKAPRVGLIRRGPRTVVGASRASTKPSFLATTTSASPTCSCLGKPCRVIYGVASLTSAPTRRRVGASGRALGVVESASAAVGAVMIKIAFEFCGELLRRLIPVGARAASGAIVLALVYAAGAALAVHGAEETLNGRVSPPPFSSRGVSPIPDIPSRLTSPVALSEGAPRPLAKAIIILRNRAA